MFGRFSAWELILILLIVLVIFGPSKLPGLGKAVGRTIREFRSANRGEDGAPENGGTAGSEEKKA